MTNQMCYNSVCDKL